MANALYSGGRQRFLDGGISWANDTIKAMLVDTGGYAVNLGTHNFLSDIPAAARVGTPQTLGTKTSTAGTADAADVTFAAVPSTAPTVEAIVIFRDTGTETTSALIAYIDTATGLPVTPNGGDIIVQWDNGANRIFTL